MTKADIMQLKYFLEVCLTKSVTNEWMDADKSDNPGCLEPVGAL